jgi:hypothetical protein
MLAHERLEDMYFRGRRVYLLDQVQSGKDYGLPRGGTGIFSSREFICWTRCSGGKTITCPVGAGAFSTRDSVCWTSCSRGKTMTSSSHWCSYWTSTRQYTWLSTRRSAGASLSVVLGDALLASACSESHWVLSWELLLGFELGKAMAGWALGVGTWSMLG